MKFESRKIAIQDQTTGKASAARYTGRQVIRYANTSADPEQGQGGPAGDDLVPVEPRPLIGAQERDDGDQADGVQQEGDAPPEEMGAAVAAVEKEEEQRQAERDRSLEEGGRELGGGEDVHGGKLGGRAESAEGGWGDAGAGPCPAVT